jgi:YfiH family protein
MREVRHPNGVVTWELALGPGATADVTTRAGGTSDGAYATCNLGGHVGDDPHRVRANRDAVAVALGLPALTIAHQVHGREVLVVDDAMAGGGHDPEVPDPRLQGYDALVTTTPDVGLAILVADCAPVALLDPGRRVLGVAHCGRLGAVADVLGATVATMGEVAGGDPADLVAAVGPCIGAGAYEIDGTALAEVEAAFGGELLVPSRPGAARFDLRGAVVRRLVGAGLRPDRIEVAAPTTDAAPELFSDRAARPCGRFALVAALRGDRGGGR